MVLYLMGERDAHVLLTMNDHPDFEHELVYEFGKVPARLPQRSFEILIFIFSFSIQSSVDGITHVLWLEKPLNGKSSTF